LRFCAFLPKPQKHGLDGARSAETGVRDVSDAVDGRRWIDEERLAFLRKQIHADGKLRNSMLVPGFVDHGVEMSQHFGNRDGVDLTISVVALFDELLEMPTGNLDGELVGDDLAGALLLLHPCGAGQGDPHGPAVDVKPNVYGVGVARGNRHDVGFPRAVKVFATPTVGHMEIFIHALKGTRFFPKGASEASHGWGNRFFDKLVRFAVAVPPPVRTRLQVDRSEGLGNPWIHRLVMP